VRGRRGKERTKALKKKVNHESSKVIKERAKCPESTKESVGKCILVKKGKM